MRIMENRTAKNSARLGRSARLSPLSPETLARLDAARRRLAKADGVTKRLGIALDQFAEIDPAVSVTPLGIAWREVDDRTRVWRNVTVKEIDALLDGDAEQADRHRDFGDWMRKTVERHLDHLIAEGDRRLSP